MIERLVAILPPASRRPVITFASGRGSPEALSLDVAIQHWEERDGPADLTVAVLREMGCRVLAVDPARTFCPAFPPIPGMASAQRSTRRLVLSRTTPPPLTPGMRFSNEPMIVVPRRFGVRLEDQFHMTEDGASWFMEPSPPASETLA